MAIPNANLARPFATLTHYSNDVMLTHIQIQNFAIVEQLDLDIPNKLCVITGETGAGKSIMLDALGLTLGDRADSDMVRAGADKAEIHCSFDISNNNEAQAWLNERDLDAGAECILRRTVHQDGRSRAYVNGTPSTLAAIKELGELLVSLHGQHEHQALLKKSTQRQLLDSFGGLNKLSADTAIKFKTWRDAENAFVHARDNARELKDRADLLSFQLQEFEQLNLQPGEYAELEQDHKRFSNVETLLSSGQSALVGLEEDDNSAILQTQKIVSLLSDMARQDGAINETLEMVQSALIQLEEAGTNLRHYLDKLDIDPERYQQIDQRLTAAYQLARKHRIDPYTINEHHQQLIAELESLDFSDEKLDALEAKAFTLKEHYLESAQELTKKRTSKGKKLSQAISSQIKTLGMPAADFNVLLHPTDNNEPTLYGLETIEFTVKTNAGQPFKALNKVASGGELSRLSLSIQVACAHQSNVATLVFDEVDVGIGGGIAQTVGKLLRQLGEDNQIICVTHQPQVAAQGHHHLHVNKRTAKQQTHTQIDSLSQDEKLMEIARMLGGLKITDQTIAHAKEMLEEAQ